MEARTHETLEGVSEHTEAGALETALLERLRRATRDAHARLDTAFSALDLASAPGCTRFHVAHALALDALAPLFAAFVHEELERPAPDFPAMLAHDLAARGVEVADLPELELPAAIRVPEGAAGLCYVIAGSRLGNAVIRAQGYHGRTSGNPSRYMEDDTGHGVWKAFTAWARARSFAANEAAAIEEAARATFAHFAAAFAASHAWEQEQEQAGAHG